jgi:hypothetical protein
VNIIGAVGQVTVTLDVAWLIEKLPVPLLPA